jgi:hypothetical protein
MDNEGTCFLTQFISLGRSQSICIFLRRASSLSERQVCRGFSKIRLALLLAQVTKFTINHEAHKRFLTLGVVTVVPPCDRSDPEFRKK